MPARSTLVALLIAATPAPGDDLRFLQGLGDIRYHRIESESVGRAFHVYVRLPEAYDQGDSDYPTVYLLDGGELLPMLAAYYRHMRFDEEVPAMILVGISYGTDSVGNGNFRGIDYTAPSPEREFWGGAPVFQHFLADELMPFVETSYRSRPDRRILFGQSIGGQFVLYTAQTRPGLFWGHIASNPAMHRNLAFFLQTVPDSRSDSKLFVASATGDDPRFREPALRWMEHWRAVAEKPWHLEAVDLEGHTHMSAPPAAFRAGISWLFAE